MKKIKELIKKYSEQLKYLIVGVATTLVSWGTLYICNDLIGMNRTDFGGTISKAIATVISVIFAFFAGKLFVFNDKDWKVKTVLGQFVKFVGGRAVTMAFEIGSVAAFADGLKVNIYVVNLIVSVVVIIANYLISKFFVFKKEKNKMSEAGYVIKKADKVDFSLANETKITNWGWNYTRHTPETTVKLIRVKGLGLALRMECKETNPRAVFTKFGESVWEDSCMEFFFGLKKGEKYINLEMNSNGAFLMGIGKHRHDRVSVTEFATPEPVKAGKGDGYWYVEAVIKNEFFKKLFDADLDELDELYGNFYKCGDNTEYPHFGMWSEVKTENPDFHQSEYFGKMVFEK